MKGMRQVEKVYNGELRCNAIKKVGSGSYETYARAQPELL